MKIVIIDRGNKIPAQKYGGTERVIWGLGCELHRAGHEVVFIVPAGSECGFAEVITYNAETEIPNLIPRDTDLIHYNFVPEEIPEIPYIVTMHGNPAGNEVLPSNTIFVSSNHAKRHNSEAFVHNGLLWDEFPEINLKRQRTYFHFLGKASWKIKNVAGAAEVAIKSGNKLKVMGGKRWDFNMLKRSPYYLLNPKIEFLGMVDDKSKIQTMQESKGLVFPVLWDEPFGLAVIESLYAGCPVFGTPKGSLPELVNDEVGFLSNSMDELVQAVKEKHFDYEACHLYAKENFSAKKMTERYLYYYNRVLEGKSLNPKKTSND